MDSLIDSLDELTLPRSRGRGLQAKPLEVEVLRSLSEEDLASLSEAEGASCPQQKLKNLRHTHHETAKLLAKGESEMNVSLITGYSPAYISTLKADPAFAALLAHYAEQRNEIFTDALKQMRDLGLNAVAELRERLENSPAKFSHREIMEAIKLCIVEPQAGANRNGGGLPAGAGNVSVSVSFISAPQSLGSKQLELEARKEV